MSFCKLIEKDLGREIIRNSPRYHIIDYNGIISKNKYIASQTYA